MQQAVREKRRVYKGLEFPIECYRIRSHASAQPKTPHYHEYIEFLYASGECDIKVWVAGKFVDFRTGDFMIINANVPHTFYQSLPVNNYICVKAVPEMLYFANNSFFDIKYVMPFVENDLLGYRFFGADEVRKSELPEIFNDALEEWIGKNYGYEVSLKSSLIRIFLWSIRQSHATGNHKETLERENSIENMRLMQRATEYINDNFSTANESEAASFVNMSYSHFSRMFKRIMGKSFKEYLTAIRINAAERMLFETDMPVTEVALACGFATSSHFIDRFKRAKGVTPKQYRQKFSDK